MSRARATTLGRNSRARILDQTAVGCNPVKPFEGPIPATAKLLEGPIPATAKLLEPNRLSVGDIDYFRVNEAFAQSSWPGAVCTVPTWSA
jgi:acetyl-CoA acetyltransferase